VTLLQSMQKKVEEEGAREAELFKKFDCYCKNGKGDLSGSIDAAEEKVPAVSSDIEGAEAKLAGAKSTLAQAQGMLKNMMIHELVVLISHFGLKVDNIKEIVPDRKYTCQEIRKGVADFSKVGFTIHMKDGQKFVLWGDRCDGEYAEAIVSADGLSMKTVRPDPVVSQVAASIEKDEPGCMPFFYFLQQCFHYHPHFRCFPRATWAGR